MRLSASTFHAAAERLQAPHSILRFLPQFPLQLSPDFATALWAFRGTSIAAQSHRWPDNRPVLPEHQKTVEEAIAEGPVSLLVSVDKTTRGYWRHEGIYQYNEFTPLKLLVGVDFPYQDPLSARAFLSEGGEIVVEGTRLCTLSPWQK